MQQNPELNNIRFTISNSELKTSRHVRNHENVALNGRRKMSQEKWAEKKNDS